MSHVTEEKLLALLDGELSSSEQGVLQDHLEGCPHCAGLLEELTTLSLRASRALALLDEPLPASTPDSVRNRAAVAGHIIRRPAPRRRGRSVLAAAVVLLAVVGAGSAAIPGSPVREWIVASAHRLAGRAPDVPAPQAPGAPRGENARPAVAASASGVAVDPAGGFVRVSVERPAPGIAVRVRLVDGARVAVRATGATYRTAPGRVQVVGATEGPVEIDLPRRIREAYVEIDGRPMLVKRAGSFRPLETPEESSPSGFVFRTGS